MNHKIISTAIIALGLASAMIGAESIQVLKKGNAFDEFRITTGLGKSQLKSFNRNWSNTYATTPSGKTINLVDPFFYNLIFGKQKLYLNHKTVWPQIKPTISADKKSLTLEQIIPGWDFSKSVKIQTVPGKNLLLVTNWVTNHTAQKQYLPCDYQCIWQGNLPNLVITIDGKVVDKSQDKTYKQWRWCAIFNQKTQVTSGVVLLPKFYSHITINNKIKGVDCQWGRSSSRYTPQETKTQKYILFWGDGNLTDQVAKLAQQAEKGQFDQSF